MFWLAHPCHHIHPCHVDDFVPGTIITPSPTASWCACRTRPPPFSNSRRPISTTVRFSSVTWESTSDGSSCGSPTASTTSQQTSGSKPRLHSSKLSTTAALSCNRYLLDDYRPPPLRDVLETPTSIVEKPLTLLSNTLFHLKYNLQKKRSPQSH